MVFVITATPANTTQAQVRSFARTGSAGENGVGGSALVCSASGLTHDKIRESRAVVPHSNRKAELLDDPAHL